jgi:hypothetical protein
MTKFIRLTGQKHGKGMIFNRDHIACVEACAGRECGGSYVYIEHENFHVKEEASQIDLMLTDAVPSAIAPFWEDRE